MRSAAIVFLLSFILMGACRRHPSRENGPTGIANPAFQGRVPADAFRVESQPGDYGGTLVMSLPSNPRSFNPITAIDSSTIWVTQGLLYRGLIDYDNSEQQVIPGLAKSWQSSADG